MGILKQLSPPSSHAAKKTPLWLDVMAAINRCVTFDQLKDCEAWIGNREMEIPSSWWGSIRDQLQLQAEEIASEDVGQILRDRFDF